MYLLEHLEPVALWEIHQKNMKKHIYYVSFSYTCSNGTTGFGSGEKAFDGPIEEIGQIEQIVQSVKDFDDQVVGVTVLFYSLLRTEEDGARKHPRWTYN